MKRLFDFSISFLGLALLAPLLMIIGILVRIKLGSPVVFKQQRPGFNGKPFMMYKFRTMTEAQNANGELLLDGERLTPFGKLLRATSIDELPELFNVLKGDMSLVGPRPLLMRYTSYFTEREKLRFTVLPGITGWAQINGRNESSWDKRLSDDIWYVEHRCFLMDLKILLRTFSDVFVSKGVVTDARSIMLNLDEERSAKKEI
ncbi:MAG: sugar transferase [Chlorobium sp.]|nr:sugar transferase [Chlorobium sp.]